MKLFFKRPFLIATGAFACLLLLSGFIQQMNEERPVAIPPSTQRLGDAEKGYQYLVTGDYVKGGIPYALFMAGAGSSKENLLKRNGWNESLPYDFTAVRADNGEVLVAPNCMQCHAQVFDNQLVIGLGNAGADFTKDQRFSEKRIRLAEKIIRMGGGSRYEASKHFLEVATTVAPYITAEVRGVNIADRLTYVLLAHRDPVTLKWNPTPQMKLPDIVIPTDTPPWWLLKKKNGMFYNGFGRGDFGKFLMGSHLLTVSDTAESNAIDLHMPDVLSYLYSIEAPAYPREINEERVVKGKAIFEATCSGCHGTYGENETYPNLLIPQKIIGTDSLLSTSNYLAPQFIEWFNRSWFTSGTHPARLEPFRGYIAPPLDGVWMTAPYLHNGSVPTLETLLNSGARPPYWSRDFNKPDYDYEKLGWIFKTHPKGKNKNVYNTDLPGYSNAGHLFGDKLTSEERRNVIEYLKTL